MIEIRLEDTKQLAKAWHEATYRNPPKDGMVKLDSWDWDSLNLATKGWLMRVADDAIMLMKEAATAAESDA